MRNINDLLSDDCLRLILLECPLLELLHLRTVCTRWQCIIELICRGKPTLKLFGSKEAAGQYLESVTNFRVPEMMQNELITDLVSDTLILKQNLNSLKYCACIEIPKLFHNVQILVIYCSQLFKCSKLSQMLSRWAVKLSALIIFKPRIEEPENFWNAISKMHSLERLHLIQMYCCKIPNRPTITRVLGKLKHFAIAHYLDDITQVLTQLGPQIESLKLSCVSLNVAQLEWLVSANPTLAQNLEMLTLGLISPHGNGLTRVRNLKDVLRFICEKFVNLSFLDILMTDHLPLIDITTALSRLPHLSKLWLYIGRHQLDPDHTKLYNLPQLKNIKSLYVEIYDLSLSQFCHWIPGIFPNLVTLSVKCDFNDQKILIENLQQCIKQEFRFIKNIEIK